jgi:hypothetical protein
MRRQHALMACALLVSAAILPTVLLLTHDHPRPAPPSLPAKQDEVHVGLEPTLNGSRTVLIRYVPAQAGATARVLVEDPARINGTLVAETNTTEGEARFPLDTLPQLFRLRIMANEPELTVHVHWCWSGRAHFVCAKTPAELAPALGGTS